MREAVTLKPERSTAQMREAVCLDSTESYFRKREVKSEKECGTSFSDQIFVAMAQILCLAITQDLPESVVLTVKHGVGSIMSGNWSGLRARYVEQIQGNLFKKPETREELRLLTGHWSAPEPRI